MLLRGTRLLLPLLDGGLDQLAMPLIVQVFADDPSHRFGDEVRHLQANRLDGPLALGVDIPPGRLHDAAGLPPGLLLIPPLNPPGGPLRLLPDFARPPPPPLNLVPGPLHPRLTLLARLFPLLHLPLHLP